MHPGQNINASQQAWFDIVPAISLNGQLMSPTKLLQYLERAMLAFCGWPYLPSVT